MAKALRNNLSHFFYMEGSGLNLNMARPRQAMQGLSEHHEM